MNDHSQSGNFLRRLGPMAFGLLLAAAGVCDAQVSMTTSEIIGYPLLDHSVGPLLTGRGVAVLAFDDDVVPRTVVREAALGVFKRDSYSNICMMSSASLYLIDSRLPKELFLFGENDRFLKGIPQEPCYVLYPKHAPPATRYGAPIVVLLNDEREGASMTELWRNWCEKFDVPFAVAPLKGASDLQDAIRKLLALMPDRYYSHGKPPGARAGGETK